MKTTIQIDDVCKNLIKIYKYYDPADGEPTPTDIAKIYNDIATMTDSQLSRFEMLTEMTLEFYEKLLEEV